MLQSSKSSGLKTESAIILSNRGVFSGIAIYTDGSHDATVTIYDNIEASGTIVFKGVVPANVLTGGALWSISVRVINGIYADISGIGISYIIYYI